MKPTRPWLHIVIDNQARAVRAVWFGSDNVDAPLSFPCGRFALVDAVRLNASTRCRRQDNVKDGRGHDA